MDDVTFYDVMNLEQRFSEKQNLEKHEAKQHCGSLMQFFIHGSFLMRLCLAS